MKIEIAPGFHLNYALTKDLEEYISNTKKYYLKSTLSCLQEFDDYTDEMLDLDTFDNITFQKFLVWLILYKRQKPSTVVKTVRNFRSLLENVYGVTVDYMTFKEVTDSVFALSQDELDILKLSPVNGKKEIALDLFLFQTSTGMKYDQTQYYIDDGLIKRFSIPDNTFARQIINKYDGEPPKIEKQLFVNLLQAVLKDCEIDRVVIKDSNILCPIWEVITEETGRQTFVLMQLAKGIPLKEVMDLTGHYDYRSMLPYIFF